MKKTTLLFLFLFPIFLFAQVDLQYQTPHKDISVLADASPAPWMRINSDGTKALLLYRQPYKSIEELSETEMRLAGLRINPKTNISSRARYRYDIKVFDMATNREQAVSGLPKNARMTNWTWSKNQKYMAFTNTVSEGVELWVLDIDQKKASRLTDAVVSANMNSAVNWLDEETILYTKLPNNRQALIDNKTSVPTGPTISVNDDGKKAQNRTYQDLLKNPIDENNFIQLATSEIWKVNLSGKETKWMAADMYTEINVSPDSKNVLVETIMKPFSYLVPYFRFPSSVTIYDTNAKKVKTVLEVPLIEDLPKGFMARRTGPRNMNWRSDKPATLYWAEAMDGGDPEKEVPFRDAVYQQDAPFNQDKELLTKTKLRFSGIEWGTEEVAICYDYWWNSRILRTSIFNPNDSDKEPTLFNERNYQDTYSNPGNFVTKKNKYGIHTLDVDGDVMHLLGLSLIHISEPTRPY